MVRDASPPIDFRSVAASVSLPALVEAACGPPNRSKKYHCCFHSPDANPSLGLFDDDRRFKCWSCLVSGDAIDFVAELERISVVDAAKRLDPALGLPGPPGGKGKGKGEARLGKPRAVPSSSPKPEAPPAWNDPTWQSAVDALVVRAEACLWSRQEGRDALDWLRRRGLEDATIRRYRLGFLPAGGWTAPVPREDGTVSGLRHERGILIPWVAPGAWYGAVDPAEGPRWVGANVRQLMPDVSERWPGEDKYKALSTSERGHAYPEPDLLDSQPTLPFLACEGELDSLVAVQECGWLAHVGTLGGAGQSPRPSAVATLDRCAVHLLALDWDAAGTRAAWSWRKREPAKSRRLLMPGGHKDLTDAFVAGVDLRDWLGSELARLGVA